MRTKASRWQLRLLGAINRFRPALRGSFVQRKRQLFACPTYLQGRIGETLILTMGVGSYEDVQDDVLHARHLEINTSLERMVRPNQKLTSMLTFSVP